MFWYVLSSIFCEGCFVHFEPLIQHEWSNNDQIQTLVAGQTLLLHCTDAVTICALSWFILSLSLLCTGYEAVRTVTQGDGRCGNKPRCCGAERFVAVDPMANDPLAASWESEEESPNGWGKASDFRRKRLAEWIPNQNPDWIKIPQYVLLIELVPSVTVFFRSAGKGFGRC